MTLCVGSIVFAQIITLDRNGDANVQENLDRWMEICARAIAISFALAGALGRWFLFALTKRSSQVYGARRESGRVSHKRIRITFTSARGSFA